MSVVTDENKQMLIELMRSIIHDNKLVIPPEVDVEGFISEQCSYFHTKRFEFQNLNEINKKIVELSYNYILSNNKKQDQLKRSSNEPIVSKRETFDNNLKIQQNNFKNMIQPKKPKKIDFSDGSKDFPMDNLGVIMNQTLADRENELKTITQQYSASDKEKAQQWLNQNSTTTSTNTIQKLTIDRSSDVTIDAIDVKQKERRVRFSIDEKKGSNIENLLLKLKKKPILKKDNAGIMDKLDLIIKNQNAILDILRNTDKVLNDKNDILEAI